VAVLEQLGADAFLGAATEEHAMRQDDIPLRPVNPEDSSLFVFTYGLFDWNGAGAGNSSGFSKI